MMTNIRPKTKATLTSNLSISPHLCYAITVSNRIGQIQYVVRNVVILLDMNASPVQVIHRDLRNKVVPSDDPDLDMHTLLVHYQIESPIVRSDGSVASSLSSSTSQWIQIDREEDIHLLKQEMNKYLSRYTLHTQPWIHIPEPNPRTSVLYYLVYENQLTKQMEWMTGRFTYWSDANQRLRQLFAQKQKEQPGFRAGRISLSTLTPFAANWRHQEVTYMFHSYESDA